MNLHFVVCSLVNYNHDKQEVVGGVVCFYFKVCEKLIFFYMTNSKVYMFDRKLLIAVILLLALRTSKYSQYFAINLTPLRNLT